MTSFKRNLETKADHKGKYPIPDDHLDAFLMKEYGWSWWEVRTTPQHIIEQILFLRNLDAIAEKANARIVNKG